MFKIFIIISGVTVSLFGANIYELFDAIGKNPSGIEEELKKQKIEISKNSLEANYYPKIEFFGSVEKYNTPMNITPLTPTESTSIMGGDKTLPFSKDLQKIGLNLQMSLFNPELDSLSEALDKAVVATKEKVKMSMIQKESTIVNANANLAYLESLENFLRAKKSSLQQTKIKIDEGVSSGKIAQAEQLKLENILNLIEISLYEVTISKIKQMNFIEAVTKIKIDKSISIQLQNKPIEGKVDESLKGLAYTIEATNTNIQAAQKSFYPKVFLQGTLLRGYGESYYNNDTFYRDVASIGLKVVIPLYDKTKGSAIEEKKVEHLQAQNSYQKALQELLAQENTLSKELAILEQSIKLLENNVENSQKLQRIAKVSYEEGRMNIEEYLRYEEELLKAQSDLAKARLKKWQNITSLALVYGIDLKEIVE
ncbi:MAG: TolC family protein [Epsilonproteobacteria bacterium]|nr:TolC family protein [Campylobacterota bacterium]